ncbi:MAG: thiol peroxidase [Chloroflexota bacterium]
MAVNERPGAATLRGNPFTLLGSELKVGDTAPDFTLVGAGMSSVSLADSKGKVRLISCVPSLDTPVCSTETRKWEAERAALGDVELITISMDLPFAQARWVGEHDVKHPALSAHKNEQFGIDYGVLIKELRILDRAVFVVDKHDQIVHVEYVKEISTEPDYGKALAAAKAAS